MLRLLTFSATLVIAMLSTKVLAKEIVLPMADIETLYLNTLGDLENNQQVPFPTVFIYDSKSNSILSKARTIDLLGNKAELLIRHTSSMQPKGNTLKETLSNSTTQKRYTAVYFVLLDWVFNSDPQLKKANEQLSKALSNHKEIELIKIYKGK